MLTEFIHIVTDPRRFTQPLDMPAASRLAEQWWTASNVVQLFPEAAATSLFFAWLHTFRFGARDDYLVNVDGQKAGLWQGFSINLHGETVYGDEREHGPGRDGLDGLQDVQAHGVAGGLVQDQGEEVEARHLMKPAGQLVEECLQVPVREDGLGDRQKGPVLPAGGKLRAVWCEVTHRSHHHAPRRTGKPSRGTGAEPWHKPAGGTCRGRTTLRASQAPDRRESEGRGASALPSRRTPTNPTRHFTPWAGRRAPLPTEAPSGSPAPGARAPASATGDGMVPPSPGKCGLQFRGDRYLPAVPQMAEVYAERLLDRDEFRRPCARFRTRPAIPAELG